MDIIIQPLLNITLSIAQIYCWIIIGYVILGWLINLNIVNNSNRIVNTILTVCYQLVEPVLNKIRNLLPYLAGIDLSPFVLLMLIHFFEMMIVRIMIRLSY